MPLAGYDAQTDTFTTPGGMRFTGQYLRQDIRRVLGDNAMFTNVQIEGCTIAKEFLFAKYNSDRERLIANNRCRASDLRWKQANKRAEQILLESLTDKQQKEWLKENSFRVKPKGTPREYRIHRGTVENVVLTKVTKYAKDSRLRAQRVFCAHLIGEAPTADHVLAQLLLLRSRKGEQAFLEVAYSHLRG